MTVFLESDTPVNLPPPGSRSNTVGLFREMFILHDTSDPWH